MNNLCNVSEIRFDFSPNAMLTAKFSGPHVFLQQNDHVASMTSLML